MNNTTLIERTAFISIGLLETSCFIFGTPLSAIILSHFILKSKGDKSASTFLHTWINLAGVLICLLNFATAISDFNYGEAMIFANKHFCNISGFLWIVSKDMYTFLITVLSIARTTSLTFPFFKVKRRYVGIPVIVYLLVLVLQSSLPFFLTTGEASPTDDYNYVRNLTLCTYSIDDVFNYNSTLSYTYDYGISLGYITQLLIVVISCCVTVYQLRAGRSELQNTEGGKKKREATITILILTGIYVVFETPKCVMWVQYLPGVPSTIQDATLKILGDYYWTSFYKLKSFTSIGLNSVCNIVVYFWRMRDLRQYVINLLRKIRERMRRGKDGTTRQNPQTRVSCVSTSNHVMSNIVVDQQASEGQNPAMLKALNADVIEPIKSEEDVDL